MPEILTEWYPLSLVVFVALLAFLWLSREPDREDEDFTSLDFDER